MEARMWVLKKTIPISRSHSKRVRTRVVISPRKIDAEVVNEVIFDALSDRFLIRQFERVPDSE
jgi:hypothetical protein